MLDNAIFCINATMPIFLMMAVGYILKKIKFMDENTTKAMNKIVFRVFLPALIYMDLAKQDIAEIWNGRFVLFCFVSTVLSIVLCILLSKLVKNKGDRGEFIQASFRSAAATLGIAFMTNIYDNVAMVALMIIGSVPLYNVVSVILLSVTSPDSDNAKGKKLFKSTLKNLVTNPIILAVFAGLLSSVLDIHEPELFTRALNYLGNVASPMALICLGAAFRFSDLQAKQSTVALANFVKLILLCALFLPVAIKLGFRDEQLVAALIMLGSATTSSSFIMATNMGHEGKISSGTIMTTTLFSSFTMAVWLFLMKQLGYI